MVVVHWLAEIANNAVPWGPIPNNLIGVRGNEDRRDRLSCINQRPVQLDSSHSRHVNVGDQASGFG
jgi:hypothetical protein